MALLPATVKWECPVSIISVPLEALVSPQTPPFALLMTAQPWGIAIQEPLPLLMPSEVISLLLLMTILIIVAIKPLRLGLRPAGDAGKGYESYGQSYSGQQL